VAAPLPDLNLFDLVPRAGVAADRALAALAIQEALDQSAFRRGVLVATGVPANDEFAGGARRLDEPGMVPPKLGWPLSIGPTGLKPTHVIEVDAVVDATGRVLRVRISKSVDASPGGPDQRALVLVRDFRFPPALLNGVPVAALIRVPVMLHDSLR
jgi:hypothetical protein